MVHTARVSKRNFFDEEDRSTDFLSVEGGYPTFAAVFIFQKLVAVLEYLN